ncbi:hypothetical protein PanWU01x14_327190 [Parasponia andersonii]|uniref:Cullin, N-terminal n=1 Tax=Parasponia andersonii TaxID=3476 RepID=A0A2P5AJB7_PARAD|nr:hypothetical protein PanWU01x14_327190 [Parasponia andersonii]
MNGLENLDESLRRMFDDEMEVVDASIEKVKMKLDHNGVEWNSEAKMNAYTTVYNLFEDRRLECVSNYMLNSFYDKYESTLNQRISGKVIPSLENKYGKRLLNEVVEQNLSKQLEEYKKNLRIIFDHVEDVACILCMSTRVISFTVIAKEFVTWSGKNSTMKSTKH